MSWVIQAAPLPTDQSRFKVGDTVIMNEMGVNKPQGYKGLDPFGRFKRGRVSEGPYLGADDKEWITVVFYDDAYGRFRVEDFDLL